MRRLVILFAAALMVAGLTASSFAGTHPHDRNGFMIGFGLGGGSSRVGGGDGSESGGTGNLRIGYAVRPDIVIGYEGSAWTKTESDLTITFSTNTAALTYFPPNTGLLLRGGVGLGTGSFEVSNGNVTQTLSESGFGFLVAGGYEWRLTRKFALGPVVEFSYQAHDLPILESSNIVSGTLNFNWYW